MKAEEAKKLSDSKPQRDLEMALSKIKDAAQRGENLCVFSSFSNDWISQNIIDELNKLGYKAGYTSKIKNDCVVRW